MFYAMFIMNYINTILHYDTTCTCTIISDQIYYLYSAAGLQVSYSLLCISQIIVFCNNIINIICYLYSVCLLF